METATVLPWTLQHIINEGKDCKQVLAPRHPNGWHHSRIRTGDSGHSHRNGSWGYWEKTDFVSYAVIEGRLCRSYSGDTNAARGWVVVDDLDPQLGANWRQPWGSAIDGLAPDCGAAPASLVGLRVETITPTQDQVFKEARHEARLSDNPQPPQLVWVYEDIMCNERVPLARRADIAQNENICHTIRDVQARVLQEAAQAGLVIPQRPRSVWPD